MADTQGNSRLHRLRRDGLTDGGAYPRRRLSHRGLHHVGEGRRNAGRHAGAGVPSRACGSERHRPYLGAERRGAGGVLLRRGRFPGRTSARRPGDQHQFGVSRRLSPARQGRGRTKHRRARRAGIRQHARGQGRRARSAGRRFGSGCGTCEADPRCDRQEDRACRPVRPGLDHQARCQRHHGVGPWR